MEKNLIPDEDKNNLDQIKNKLLNIRRKRVKPFFDDKSQTDLNAFWTYTNLYSSIILNDKALFDKSINNFENLNQIYQNKLFHCYNDNKQIDVFLEDYVYFCLHLRDADWEVIQILRFSFFPQNHQGIHSALYRNLLH